MKHLFLSIIVLIFTSSGIFGQELILIRHAEVDLDHSGWMSPKKAAHLRDSYDTAPVQQFDPASVLAEIPKCVTDTIYVSSLSRSIITGVKLYGDSATLISMELLNEFELNMIWLPIYLPYKGWTSLSRSMWLLGAKKQDTESYREAKKRVIIAASFIEEKAASQKQVILVTHGFLNRNIAKELKKRNWKIIKNEGKENLGATVLRK